MIDLFSYTCIAAGIVFWFWGTLPLVGHRSVLFKLHSLSVADTLGSMAIVFGLLLKIPRVAPAVAGPDFPGHLEYGAGVCAGLLF
jgi:multicomponent Na+:H+ antiporter subunit G